MAERKLSREYLEEALKLAREHLPTWAWAMLHAQARPRSGGRARARADGPSELEKLALPMLMAGDAPARALSDDALRAAWLRVSAWLTSAQRRKEPVEDFVNAGVWLAEEMDRRGLDVAENNLLHAVAELGEVSKKLTEKQQAAFDRETEQIRENKRKPVAQAAHPFKAAEWTHPNGHPRCLVCGDEEPVGGMCEGVAPVQKRGGFEELAAWVDGRWPVGIVPTTLYPEPHQICAESPAAKSFAQALAGLPEGANLHGGWRPDGRRGTFVARDLVTDVVEVPFSERRAALETFFAKQVTGTEGIELAPLRWAHNAEEAEQAARLFFVDAAQGVDVFRAHAFADKADSFHIAKMTKTVAPCGPVGAPVAFVTAAPSRVEGALGRLIVGETFSTFAKQYLAPLGVAREQVALLSAVPEVLVDAVGKSREPAPEDLVLWRGWLLSELDRLAPRTVVALGRTAAEALGKRANFVLPHPSAVARYGNSREVPRKMRRIAKSLRALPLAKVLDEGDETQAERADAEWRRTWVEQLPPSGTGRFVYQHHWRGLDDPERELSDAQLLETDHSLHGDLRFEGADDRLFGWSILLGETSANRSSRGDRLVAGDAENVRLVSKLPQPAAWLDVGRGEPFVVAPGGAGATANTSAKLFAIDAGTYSIGVVREHAVEIFLDGKHLRGRYMISSVPTETGTRVWLIQKPSEQKPIAATREVADVVRQAKRDGAQYLVWGQPGARPRRINVQTEQVEKTAVVPILKADEEKQIVYGVVLDPYQIDAHNDWISPAEIENTAHGWLQRSPVVSLNHQGPSQSKAVESWIEQYPPGEYSKAMAGKPHRAYRRKFGRDTIHSGAWLLGTRLSDAEWQAYKRGELQAYSIEGFGMRTPMKPGDMPKVTFVDLVEKG